MGATPPSRGNVQLRSGELALRPLLRPEAVRRADAASVDTPLLRDGEVLPAGPVVPDAPACALGSVGRDGGHGERTSTWATTPRSPWRWERGRGCRGRRCLSPHRLPATRMKDAARIVTKERGLAQWPHVAALLSEVGRFGAKAVMHSFSNGGCGLAPSAHPRSHAMRLRVHASTRVPRRLPEALCRVHAALNGCA